MGKNLDEVKRLDKIIRKIQKALRELVEMATKTKNKETKRDLTSFVMAYALINYQFTIYNMSKCSKAYHSDKIDKQFEDIVKNVKFKGKKNGK